MGSSEPSQKYTASCHCSLLTYTITLSAPLHASSPQTPVSVVTECNCTICTRNGNLNIYIQRNCLQFTSPVTLDSDLVEKYKFGKGRVQHYFCSRCGSSLMAESTEKGFYEGVLAVNVRMIHDVDVEMLQRRRVDGKSL